MSSHAYMLRRDQAATTRLNSQHMQWVDTLGYLLHPEIEAASQSADDFEIIDIGTGTGIVPLQLSKHLAKQPKSLVGVDISAAQYPRAAWLPENVQLLVGDALDPDGPAAELCGRFDAVHVRYFLSLIRDDPNPFIDYISRLLKPGGYLQWGEVLMSSMGEASSHGREAPGIEGLASFLRGKLATSWVDRLPETLRERGFEIVEVVTPEVEPWQRSWYVNNLASVASEFRPPVSESIVDQVNAELEEGSWMKVKFISIVARLPVSE